VARNRLLLLAAAAGAAVVAVVVVVLVASGGGSSAPTPTAVTATSGSGESTFAGVPQRGDTLGRATAPATLTVFEDPQCPYCREWNLDTLPTVVDQFVRSGRLKVVYRGIEIVGPNSVDALRGIYAAGRENRLWNMTEAVYLRQGAENSGWITDAVLREAASEAGASPRRVLAAADGAPVTAMLQASAREAGDFGVNATPTFVLQRQLGSPQAIRAGLEPGEFIPALQFALQ
jgi:protein-disulfide isomerase